MRCEAEVHARLQANEGELQSLRTQISRLSVQVTRGGEDYRAALEMLHTLMNQRRILEAQLDSLRWVLAQEAELLAG